MASKTQIATFRPWGPGFLSSEDVTYGPGTLGVDYTENVDTRWRGKVTLGPKINVIACSAAAGTAANSSGQALSNGMNATLYIYAIRGTKWAKIKAVDMTLTSTGAESALAEAATSIKYTKNAAGTEEISIGMDNTAYRVITTVSGSTTDTHAANDSAVINAIIDYGSPSNTMAGMGRATTAGTANNVVRQNVLVGTVSMKTPTWSTKAAVSGETYTPTGFALDANYWILGTSNGPYFLDSDFLEFRPEIDEIPNSTAQDATYNCAQMGKWIYLGVIVPLANGLRFQKSIYSGASIGPDRFPANTSPIQGACTGVAGTDRWLYLNIFNPVTGDTYLCACRPPQPGEPSFGPAINYYPIHKFTGTRSNYLQDIGTYGGRTNPTLMGGSGSDVFWMTEGRLPREIDDTNYRYTSSGSLYLTELRRNPHQDKAIKWIAFETDGCSATKTIALFVTTVDMRGVETTIQLGATVTSNGTQRWILPESMQVHSRRLKFRFDLDSDDDTASPMIVSELLVGYELWPLKVDGMTIEGES